MEFKKEIKNIQVYKAGKPIEEVKRKFGIKYVYKLASNENPFVPYYIKDAINKELKNINRYPETDCFYLKDIISKKLKVSKDQIVIGNGSDEIIVLTLRAYIEKGDEVIVAYPTFLIYEIQAKIHQASVKRVPLKNFRYSLNDMAKNITKKTKIIFIANPDNPTGTYLTHNEVEDFLNKIPKDIIVFFDEAYYEFAPSDFPRSLEFLKNRKNIIISRTFSKVYALAGLRVGYAITTKEIANILNLVREPFNVNRFAQVAAISALKNDKFLKNTVSYILKEKEYLYSEFSKLKISFIKSATNFILVDFKRDTERLYNYLLKRGIIIRPMNSWGLNNFFRITIGKHKENKIFVKYFREYINKEEEKT